jgi:transcriptional regulator with XRE-family HTH domain
MMSTPNGYEGSVVQMDNYYPRLKDLREDHDLSQQQVADYLAMKQPQYSRYERGLRNIPTDVLIRLAQLYHTSTNYILGLTNASGKRLINSQKGSTQR